MKANGKIDLAVFTALVVAIALISTILFLSSRVAEPEFDPCVVVMYNAGLGADCSGFLNNPDYSYVDAVKRAYDYFTGASDTIPGVALSVRTHTIDESLLFERNPSVEKYSQRHFFNPMRSLETRIKEVVMNGNSLSSKSRQTREAIAKEIYWAIMDFSRARVQIKVAGNLIELDFSRVDPKLVAAIMVVESTMNPFALREERSLLPSYDFIYSRGLMQIYELTLWSLNTWLRDSGVNVQPLELWSIRNNVFLGMLYLAYATHIVDGR
jgi:hypothetical protein